MNQYIIMSNLFVRSAAPLIYKAAQSFMLFTTGHEPILHRKSLLRLPDMAYFGVVFFAKLYLCCFYRFRRVRVADIVGVRLEEAVTWKKRWVFSHWSDR